MEKNKNGKRPLLKKIPLRLSLRHVGLGESSDRPLPVYPLRVANLGRSHYHAEVACACSSSLWWSVPFLILAYCAGWRGAVSWTSSTSTAKSFKKRTSPLLDCGDEARRFRIEVLSAHVCLQIVCLLYTSPCPRDRG
eukprot:4351295-Amphidinium_carterae.1